MIVIVNYGLGNLSSVQNMLRRAGAKVVVSDDAKEILNAKSYCFQGWVILVTG